MECLRPLSPCNGERVAEGQERGMSANLLIIIGKWYQDLAVLPDTVPVAAAAL